MLLRGNSYHSKHTINRLLISALFAMVTIGGMFTFVYLSKDSLRSESTQAAVPRIINYQAKVTDASGVTVSDGSYAIKFAIYDASTGGTCLYVASGTCSSSLGVTTTLTSGVFSVLLGATSTGFNELTTSTLNNEFIYLGITIGTDSEMTPRKRIGSSPFAINSLQLTGLDAQSAGGTSSYIVAANSTGNLTITGTGTSTFSMGATFATSGGGVGIGTSTLDQGYGMLQIVSQTDAVVSLFRSSDNVSTAVFLTSKSRGTPSARTIVQQNDILGGFQAEGYDGTGSTGAGGMRVLSDGTPGVNDMPGRLIFYTVSDGTTIGSERMRINSRGEVGIGTNYTGDLGNSTGEGTGPARLTIGRGGIDIGTGLATTTVTSTFFAFNKTTANASGTFYIDPSGNTYTSGSLNVLSTVSTSTFANGILMTGGSMSLGTSTVTNALTISANQSATIGIYLASDIANTDPAILGLRSRLGGLNVQKDDELFSIAGQGLTNGSTYATAAQIKIVTDGVVGSNDMPGRIEFYTTADGSANSLIPKMVINNRGEVAIGNNMSSTTNARLTLGNGGIDIGNNTATTTVTSTFFRLNQTSGNSSGTFYIDPSGNTFASGTLTVYGSGTSTFSLGATFATSGGGVGIGTSTLDQGLGLLQIVSQTDAIVSLFRSSDNASAPVFAALKSRGTPATRTIVQENDILGAFQAYGYDGVDHDLSGGIRIISDGTPGVDDMPGRIVFFTASDGGTVNTERMRINSRGEVGIGASNVLLGNNSGEGTGPARLTIGRGGIDIGTGLATTTVSSTFFRLNQTSTNSSGSFYVDPSGNITSSGTIRVVDGTATLPSYSFISESNTGIYRSAASALSIAANGSERLRVTSADVLINDSTSVATITGSASDNPGFVINNVTAGARPTFIFRNNHNSMSDGDMAGRILFTGGTGNNRLVEIRSTVVDTSENSANLVFFTANGGAFTENMRINNRGEVTVGTVSSSSARLTVANGGIDIGSNTATTTVSSTFFRLNQTSANSSGTFYIDPSGNTFASGTLAIYGSGTSTFIGNIAASGTITANCRGACVDLAEAFASSEAAEPGDVLEMQNGVDNKGEPALVRKVQTAYATKIAGVVSTNPAIVFQGTKVVSGGWGNDPWNPSVALVGRVPVKVSNESGRIRAGDLLVSASLPGFAMRYDEVLAKQAKAKNAAIIGIAMDDLPDNATTGSIIVFLRSGYKDADLEVETTGINGSVLTNNTNLDLNGYSILNVKSISGLGDWSIDESGTLRLSRIETKEVQTSKLEIKPTTRENKTAGRGVIKSLQKSIIINNPNITADSEIFATFGGDINGSWFIKNKVPGQSFTLELSTEVNNDLPFAYWIVNIYDDAPILTPNETNNSEADAPPSENTSPDTDETPSFADNSSQTIETESATSEAASTSSTP